MLDNNGIKITYGDDEETNGIKIERVKEELEKTRREFKELIQESGIEFSDSYEDFRTTYEKERKKLKEMKMTGPGQTTLITRIAQLTYRIEELQAKCDELESSK